MYEWCKNDIDRKTRISQYLFSCTSLVCRQFICKSQYVCSVLAQIPSTRWLKKQTLLINQIGFWMLYKTSYKIYKHLYSKTISNIGVKKLDSYTHKIIKSVNGCLILLKDCKLIQLWLSQHMPLKKAIKHDPVYNQFSSWCGTYHLLYFMYDQSKCIDCFYSRCTYF